MESNNIKPGQDEKGIITKGLKNFLLNENNVEI